MPFVCFILSFLFLFLNLSFFVIPFKKISVFSLSITYSDFIFILTIWINCILSSLFWKLYILFLIPMVVSLEHTCLTYQYLILINTFILFQETAIIWKLVIPFTLSWFNVLLLWYIFRSLSFKIHKTLFLSFYAIFLRFLPMNLSLSFFLSTFQTSQTFLSGIILPSAGIYLLEFALREVGGLQLVKILFFLCFKCL